MEKCRRCLRRKKQKGGDVLQHNGLFTMQNYAVYCDRITTTPIQNALRSICR